MPLQPTVNKPTNYQRLHRFGAFTILEVIIVLVIVAILSSYAISRFSSSREYSSDVVAQQIISAGRLTQQLTMNDSSRNFILSIGSSNIDLLSDGTSFSSGGISFPVLFTSDVIISPVGQVVFNRFGETNSTAFTITAESSTRVCFESSGYIHQC